MRELKLESYSFNNHLKIFEMRKYFLVAAAALMMVGCSKEQSEFTSNDLKNDALPQGTVVGTVKYDAGAYKDANGVIFDEHFVPAAGQQVKIEIANKDYVKGATGNQVTLVQIGDDGKFSCTLPLGLAATDVNVSVIPFYAEKKVIVAGEFVSIPDALYNNGVGPTKKSMTNKDVKTFDFNVTSDATVEERMSQKVSVSGRVLLHQWIKDPDDATNFIKDNKAVDKKWTLTCEVTTYDENGDPDKKYTKTGIQTNNEGLFSFTVNLPDNWLDATFMPDLKISTKPELDNEFSGRYYDKDKSEWKSQTCQVLYPSVDVNYSLSSDNEIIPAKVGDLIIDPELQEKAGIKGIGNPDVDYDGMTQLYKDGSLNTQWDW